MYVASFKCKYTCINPYEESSKLQFVLVAYTCICDFYHHSRNAARNQVSYFSSRLYICTFYQHHLPSAYLSTDGWKEKELSFSFYIIIFNETKLRKNMIRFLDSPFLRAPILVFRLWRKLWFEWKVWPLGTVSTPAYLVLSVTWFSSIWVSLNSHPSWVPGVLYLSGPSHIPHGNGTAKNKVHILRMRYTYVYLLCSCSIIPTDFP